MPNSIIYNVSTQSLALKKGNFYIGTGDVGKGPSSSTGYFDGVSPVSGGYVIYVRNSSGKNLIYGASNDSQLILITNRIAGASYTTVNECLVYFAGQTDKMVLNRNYESIVTSGLVLNLDAGFTPSYPRSNTTWYDTSLSGNNGTLTNGPMFNSGNGGSIVFDGTDDYVTLGTQTLVTNDFSLNIWFNSTSNVAKEHFIISFGYSSSNSFLLTQDTQNDGQSVFQAYYVVNGVVTGRSIATSTYPNTSIINICFVRQNGINTPYINGVPQTARIFTENVTLGSLTYVLGWAIPRNKGSAYMQGNIYISQIYNRALSATEVLQNYNAQKGRFGL